MSRRKNRIFAFGLAAVLLVSSLPCFERQANAAVEKSISLSQVQQLAVANSEKYKNVLTKIELQEIKYAAAVKSIRMKKKNMTTFRWTPLLSFKFPEQPALADEYDWQYKPLQITCVIQQLKHQLDDEKYAARESSALLYVEIYTAQQKIEFTQGQLDIAKEAFEKNQAKLATGMATQDDVEEMSKKVDNLTSGQALLMRDFEAKKVKLSGMIGMDISTGYRFTDPYVQSDIPRSILKELEEYTLENDQEFYVQKLDTQIARTGLDLTEKLMKSQYGSKMNQIEPYITQAKNGENIDSSAFKTAYKQFLEDVDAPWNGSIGILFIKIQKEWFKGEVSGSRYVEDDPYQLYTQALEYAQAVRDQKKAEEELREKVDDSFETLITAKNAYESSRKLSESMKKETEKAESLNRLGELTYEEYTEQQTAYEEQQTDSLALLSEYSKLLYSYDRLTCGGITAYLEGTDFDLAAASGGNSYLAEELDGEVYYYLDHRVENQMFVLGISVPENYSLDITHFALYVNGEKIGEKTEKDQEIEHLALDLEQVDRAQIYLYSQDELLEICDFDSTVNQAALEIKGGYAVKKEAKKTVASYSYTKDRETGMVKFKLEKRASEPISYYQFLNADGDVIGTKDLVEITEPFSYLELMAGDLSQLSVRFYDSSKTELYVGTMDIETSSIQVEE